MSQVNALAQQVLVILRADAGLWAQIESRNGIYVRMHVLIPEVEMLIAARSPLYTERLNMQRELASLIRDVLR